MISKEKFLVFSLWVCLMTAPFAALAQLAGIRSVAVGENHTCVLTTEGSVKCWGLNNEGELGIDPDEYFSALTPVDVPNLSNRVVDITAGSNHTCALTAAGGVKCWGDNRAGQLGNDSEEEISVLPVDVSGLTNGVRAISASYMHTCALTSGGGIKCWGYKKEPKIWELSSNPKDFARTPEDVPGLTSGATAISAGVYCNCAITAGGGVRCWGFSPVFGSFFNGKDTPVAGSTAVTDIAGITSGVTAVSIGLQHACAVSSGAVKCWGVNIHGILGLGSTQPSLISSPSTNVSGLSSGVAGISAGGDYNCVLTAAGQVKCWGNNTNGQLGNNSTVASMVPVEVFGLASGVTRISAGPEHACAIIATGGIKCWGNNRAGQLGNKSKQATLVPVEVSDDKSGNFAYSLSYLARHPESPGK